jgi:cation diffusion facilitator family transporter
MDHVRQHRRNQWAQAIVLIAGIILMGVKFVAWWITNSNAILTDALESIINIVAGGFALYSLILSAKPQDENHPYGHGKVEFLATGFEGSLVILAGIAMIVKGGYNLFNPQEIASLDLGMIIVAVAGFINYGMGGWLERQGKKHHSYVLQADGKHLKTDGWSSAGLLVGLGLVYLTGIVWIDNLTAIVFGFIILYAGYRLTRTSIAGIMDEADTHLISDLITHLDQNRSPNWIDIHNFRIIKYGGTLHIDCHMTVPWFFDVREAHQEVEKS